jgi:hypothetical protein
MNHAITSQLKVALSYGVIITAVVLAPLSQCLLEFRIVIINQLNSWCDDRNNV